MPSQKDLRQNSNILSCLIRHAEGYEEMSQSRVTAALGLLKKVMPDLSYSESDNTYTVEGPTVIEIRAFGEESGN